MRVDFFDFMSKPWCWFLGFLSLVVILVFVAAFALPDDRLHVVFCDVGQGDAILIYRKRVQILVDGGPDAKILSCLSRHVPFWDRTIELVVVSNSDLDHYGGIIDVLRRYEVGTIATSGVVKDDVGFEVLEGEVEQEKPILLFPGRGDVIKTGVVVLEVLWPEDNVQVLASDGQVLGSRKVSGNEINENSLVFLLEYGDFDLLLTGDVVPPASDEVAGVLDRACREPCLEVLKVPHHGSKNGLTAQLLDAVRPELAVISVGKSNRYGHPHAEVMKLLNDRAIRTLRTDIEGEIEVVTDGRTWRVED